MSAVRQDIKYAYTNLSAFTIYGDMLGHVYFDPGRMEYNDYLIRRKKALLKECMGANAEKSVDCTNYVDNGHAVFCKSSEAFPFCNGALSLPIATPPLTTTTKTTTTTATVEPTTPSSSFSIVALFGGFAGGAVFGFCLFFLMLYVCRKKRNTSLEGSSTVSKKKGKKGKKKNRTSTGSFESTGSLGTTNMSTSGGVKGKKRRKKKGKKGKTSTTQTATSNTTL